MATQLQGGNTPCLAATPSDPRPTVLVFDSGVGGLSVYNEIRSLLPDLHYIYAFDNVAFPYGEKSEEFIVEPAYPCLSTPRKNDTLARRARDEFKRGADIDYAKSRDGVSLNLSRKTNIIAASPEINQQSQQA